MVYDIQNDWINLMVMLAVTILKTIQHSLIHVYDNEGLGDHCQLINYLSHNNNFQILSCLTGGFVRTSRQTGGVSNKREI